MNALQPRIPFVDRRREMAELGDFLSHPPSGPDRHRAIVSARRTGKTELIREFQRRHRASFLPYLEVQHVDETAESFTRHVLLAYLLALDPKAQAPLALATNIVKLGQSLPRSLRERISELLNVAAAGGLPDDELRAAALTFGEVLLASERKRGVLFLDECHGWFAPPGATSTRMELSFAGVCNAADRLRFVVTGSATRVMRATFREDPSSTGQPRPLHARFSLIELAEFTERDVKDLADKIWQRMPFGAEAASRLFTLTRGQPAAVAKVAELTATRARLSAGSIDAALVERSFVDALFDSSGVLGVMMEADYAKALAGKVRPKLTERLLSAIAELGPQRATGTEIAKRTKTKQPNVARDLDPLLDIDILRFDHGSKTYSFSTALMPMWLRGRSAWAQSGQAGQAYTPTLQVVTEELERYRQEVAIGAEAIARDLAGRLDGGPLPGELFDRPGTLVTLPVATKPVRALKAVDRDGVVFPKGTSVQVDLCVEGPSAWVGEVKTRGRVTAKMVKHLKDKAEVLRHERIVDAKALWFISSSGFDSHVFDYARSNGIYLSRSADLKKIGDLLKQPPTSKKRNTPLVKPV